MLLTVVLLLAAVGLLAVSLSTGHIVLAWGSVALSALVAVRILVRWRRRRDSPEPQPVELPDGEPGTEAPVTSGHGDRLVAPAPSDVAEGVNQEDDAGEPGEEDTGAADLLVVYELTDEVLVIDEHPRYHLVRCPWPGLARAERLPVREARELGFTPCERCRPDEALARKHRAAGAATPGPTRGS